MTAPDDLKSKLRIQALERRAAAAERPDALERAHLVAAAGVRVAQDCRAQRVAGYLPIKGELDTGPLIDALHGAGMQIALPVVTGKAMPLEMRAWAPGEPLEKGHFGIPEPAARQRVVPGLLFVPLVAFDAACYRLGYGGGFYDRTLAQLTERLGVCPPSYGIAFDEQSVGELPRGPYDVQLSGVITPTGIRRP